MVSRLFQGKEVAKILSVSKAFAYRLMAEGQIPTVRLGRAVRVRPEDLEQFIAEHVSQKQSFPTPFTRK